MTTIYCITLQNLSDASASVRVYVNTLIHSEELAPNATRSYKYIHPFTEIRYLLKGGTNEESIPLYNSSIIDGFQGCYTLTNIYQVSSKCNMPCASNAITVTRDTNSQITPSPTPGQNSNYNFQCQLFYDSNNNIRRMLCVKKQ